MGIDGKTFENVEAHPRAHVITATTKYFDVLRVKPQMGRLFDGTDVNGGALVVVVDETFARQHLPEGPIGRRIRFGIDSEKGTTFDSSPWLTVIGVVPALVEPGPANNNNAATVFRPLSQRPRRDFFVFAATGDDPTAVALTDFLVGELSVGVLWPPPTGPQRYPHHQELFALHDQHHRPSPWMTSPSRARAPAALVKCAEPACPSKAVKT